MRGRLPISPGRSPPPMSRSRSPPLESRQRALYTHAVTQRRKRAPMKVVYSEDHRLHFPQGELYGGEFVTPFERPSRIEYILRELKKRKMDDLMSPAKLDMKPVAKVHDKGFLEFLESAWREWTEAGFRGEIIPTGFAARGMRAKKPNHIDGKV